MTKKRLTCGSLAPFKQASKTRESLVVKIKQLLATCQTASLPSLHLSEQKLIIHLVFAMTEARQVQFWEIATHFTTGVSPSLRIKHFFAEFFFNERWLVHIMMNRSALRWLPFDEFTRWLNRNNWQLGSVLIFWP